MEYSQNYLFNFLNLYIHIMKYLKIFENFQTVHEICNDFGITNYIINSDGTIDVNGDVNISNKGLIKIPIKFNKITGNFACNRNKLTSLEGSPKSVGGNFACYRNKLTSLEGSPQSVGGDFYCAQNELVSLDGGPQSIGGHFHCQLNPIHSLWVIISEGNKWDSEVMDLLYDFDIFRNGKILRDRLNNLLNEIGKRGFRELPNLILI